MSCLWLHVGAGKTGTSYIQHVFEANREPLIESGISYPCSSVHESSVSGLTSSGNGHVLKSWINTGNQVTPGTDCLFSREQFLSEIPDAIEEWEKWIKESEFTEVKVLLVVRDPHEWVASCWGQEVKNGGETRSPDEFFEEYEHAIVLFERMLVACDNVGWRVTLRKYTREAVPTIVSEWIGPLQFPDITVNRSLSRSEAAIIQTLSGLIGARTRLAARALCDEIPDIKGWRPHIGLELSDESVRSLEFVNRMLPDGEKMTLNPPPAPQNGTTEDSLTEKQKSIIVNALRDSLCR